VPEVTPGNCYATMERLVTESGDIFRRGIANAFSGLDRRFRSHDGFKIGSRVVLTYFHREGFCYGSDRVCETLRDIEKTFRILDGKPPTERGDDITAKASSAMTMSNPKCVVEDEYFILKAFKNGNAHLWFKRDDLLLKVNALLAEYYGAALGDVKGRDSETHHPNKTGLAKNLGFFPTPEPVAAKVCEEARLYRSEEDAPLRILEPSAGTGALVTAAVKASGKVLPSVVAIEIHRERCETLARDPVYGRVVCADFLQVTPDHIGLYDRVIMNPPFDGGRDIDHVRHAVKFLKPGGILVAIMSAGAEFRDDAKTVAFREMCEHMRPSAYACDRQWHDLPAGSFKEAGTNVNTCIVVLRKPEEK
jgi:predicted RNA methylase